MTKKTKRTKDVNKQKVLDELSSEQQRLVMTFESLTAEVQEIAHAHEPTLEEIRRLLVDVLVAQQRTNQLLELALRAGFDDDERAWHQSPPPSSTADMASPSSSGDSRPGT